MTHKSSSTAEETYRLLCGTERNRTDPTLFTRVVEKRLKIADILGVLGNSEEEAEAIKRRIKKDRKAFTKDFERRQKKIRKQLRGIRKKENKQTTL